ncbi:MADS-box transcription factor family protein [Striga asiatica]|uniref:MADS-box transcription factor family protein n=1 Tax=Striga asiatica TaxID=4170 RepID=A0A5A7P2Z7_STRAF|nr:MADS-box transcription factor family protein [Striga asiatica]
MEVKRTKGRQRIPIKKIEKESDCFATFSKRRLGLFKKASELSKLCKIDIGLVIFSPTGKPFSFFHPNVESVFGRTLSPIQGPNKSDAARLLEAHSRIRVSQINWMLERLGEQLEIENEREGQMEVLKAETCGEKWWENESIDKFGEEKVGQLTPDQVNITKLAKTVFHVQPLFQKYCSFLFQFGGRISKIALVYSRCLKLCITDPYFHVFRAIQKPFV